MFQSWETFYLLVGTSAAALVGIMFVVITLAADISVAEIDRGTVVYQTPTVFHFGVIFATSALVLTPDELLAAIGALLLLIAAIAFIYSAVTTRRTFERYDFYTANIADKLLFGLIPSALYLVMGAGALAIFVAPHVAAETIGAAMLSLLLVSVRNAWDVATFSARMARTTAAKSKSVE